MSTFTKEIEQYIEHEVKLRVHDEKFIALEKKLDHLNNKLNLIFGFVITGIATPIILHWLKLV